MEEIIVGGQPIKHSVWDDYVPIITNGRQTNVYLTNSIEAPAEYNQLCHILDNAYKGDTVTLHINNGGGYVDSGFMIVNSIKNSKAKVTAKLSGTVASVATIITLACSEIEIAPYINFMIHNYSSGGGGASKGHELRAMVEFTDTQLNKAFSSVYANFVTSHEIELIIAGKDLWMGTDEVIQRFKFMKTEDLKGLEEYVKTLKK
jgi:ATP-dependent protease ClpP protease subunit